MRIGVYNIIMSLAYKKRNHISLSDRDLELLEVVKNTGPCTSQQVHASYQGRYDLLTVMRSMHHLVEKGFLQRVIINKTQLYKTSRNYRYIESYRRNSV